MACFSTPTHTVRELAPGELPALQALFEANPDYFLAANGCAPRADEARQELDDLPPPHLPFGRRWFCGVFDAHGQLQGVVVVLSDLGAPGVWHIALFLLDAAVRGRGVAQPLHQALQAWAVRQGAQWLRLGVLDANAPGRRFWARCGYQPVRTRAMVDAVGASKRVWVMAKPLAGGTLADYLARMPRDDPASTLP